MFLIIFVKFKDIQLCVDFDPECVEFWLYYYRITNKRRKFNKSYGQYLHNFAEESYH